MGCLLERERNADLRGAYDAPVVSGIHSRPFSPCARTSPNIIRRLQSASPSHSLPRRIPYYWKSKTQRARPRPRHARTRDTKTPHIVPYRVRGSRTEIARLPHLPSLARPPLILTTRMQRERYGRERLLNAVEAHLRTHKPVAVLATGHPAPSGAPAEQTTDTNTSFSLQATVLSPVTMRNPAVAAVPGGPASP
jgi:hypothetical protein